MYKIFVDSDSDFTLEECRKYDLGLISMPYEIEGENVYPYFDWETYDEHEFYNKLRSGILPSTSAVNPEEYVQLMEPFFKEGKDIIYVSFSHALSSTFNALRLAQEQLKEKYPERFIEVIDTKGITGCAYLAGIEIIEYIQSGEHSLDEIRSFAKDTVEHTACYLYADNLKFFAKSGRVSGFSAFVGGIIGIKPIIYLNEEGKMLTVDKVRGRAKAISALVKYVKDLGDDLKNHMLVVAHTDFLEGAEEFVKEVKAALGDDLKIRIQCVNPTNGAHAGPDCVAVAFHAIHR